MPFLNSNGDSGKISSIYVVHTQTIALGKMPFLNRVNNLRPCWEALFLKNNCYSEYKNYIKTFCRFEEVEDQYYPKNYKPDRPFIPYFGSVIFDAKSIRIGSPGYDSRGWHQIQKIILNRENPILRTHTGIFAGQIKLFGYDNRLKDQRMNLIYFEPSTPLALKAINNDNVSAKGKVFIHIYPSGYLVLHLAVSIVFKGDCDASRIKNIIRETYPWRKNNNTWVWASKLGKGSLPNIYNKVIDILNKSFYKNNGSKSEFFLEPGEWHSALNVSSSLEAREIARILNTTNYEYINMGGSGDLDSVPGLHQYDENGNLTIIVGRSIYNTLISKRFLICNFSGLDRKKSLKFFWKHMSLYEFVILKKKIYKDYIDFFDEEIIKLENVRFNPSSNLREITKLTEYNSEIRPFLNALDKHIKNASPFQRYSYSVISNATGFSDIREKAKNKMKNWIDEVKEWNNPLKAILLESISYIRKII